MGVAASGLEGATNVINARGPVRLLHEMTILYPEIVFPSEYASSYWSNVYWLLRSVKQVFGIAHVVTPDYPQRTYARAQVQYFVDVDALRNSRIGKDMIG